MLTTITSKGQVTIPKTIRDAWHLHPGDKLDFIFQNDQLIVKTPKLHVQALAGILKRDTNPVVSIEEMNRAMTNKAAKDFKKC